MLTLEQAIEIYDHRASKEVGTYPAQIASWLRELKYVRERTPEGIENENADLRERLAEAEKIIREVASKPCDLYNWDSGICTDTAPNDRRDWCSPCQARAYIADHGGKGSR